MHSQQRNHFNITVAQSRLNNCIMCVCVCVCVPHQLSFGSFLPDQNFWWVFFGYACCVCNSICENVCSSVGEVCFQDENLCIQLSSVQPVVFVCRLNQTSNKNKHTEYNVRTLNRRGCDREMSKTISLSLSILVSLTRKLKLMIPKNKLKCNLVSMNFVGC